MPEPHLRAGDDDRERVAAALGKHMAAGRLTLAEYEERLARARRALVAGLGDDVGDRAGRLPVRVLGTMDFDYSWPMWVIGPWGAALLVSRLGSGSARPRDESRQLGR